MKIKISNANTPTWKDVTVKSRIPEELKKLEELARNIWWAWNYEAIELFRDLDPALWKEAGQNPEGGYLSIYSSACSSLPRLVRVCHKFRFQTSRQNFAGLFSSHSFYIIPES